MTFCVKILGTSGAIPAFGRNHSCQVLNINSRNYLIDCGEGTQNSLIKYNIKPSKIDAVFISHLHGDHYLGFIGLVSSFHLLGRTKPLKVFAPRGLREIITPQLKYSNTTLQFDIILEELDEVSTDPIFETKSFTVVAFPLNHRIPCFGFRFEEKGKPYRLDKSKQLDSLSIENIGKLKKGIDGVDEAGKPIRVKDFTNPPRPSRSFAYCSDTIYSEEIIPYIERADLLYHESTFLEDKKEMATQTFHSTAKDAATIAKKAGVSKLLLGHYSARYRDLNPFAEEARQVFRNSYLAIEGEEHCIEE